MLKKMSIEYLCTKLRPIYGKKIDDLYFRYIMAETDDEKEEISHYFYALYKKKFGMLLDKRVLLQPPSENVMNGNYFLANVVYDNKKLFRFKLREEDWPRHVCISGMSGSGKTTLAFNILDSFIENNKPFLVFDWKKSFRPLLKRDSNVVCFTIGNNSVTNYFKTNINKPPQGIHPKEWINILCDLLLEAFDVSFGVHKILLETLDNAFEEWGVYIGSENYPTWNHIKWYLEEKLKSAKGRESGWLESALRIATVLTFGNFGEVCNYKGDDSLNIEDILNKRVIFELNSLGNIEKRFFCDFVLTYIYKYKKANYEDNHEKFDHAILVDEAHNIFLKTNTSFVKEPITDVIYREMREYGTSLICLDQHISKLSDTIKGNSACNIAFQQQLPQDVTDISGLMQMKEERDFFTMLPVGSAIVKLSERYTEPFIIRVSPSKIRDNPVTTKEMIERTRIFFDESFVNKEIDKDFNKEIIDKKEEKGDFSQNKEKENKKNQTSESLEIQNNTKEKVIEASSFEQGLTEKQKILYNFILKKIKKGESVGEIRRLLEEYKDEGGYTIFDIESAVNSASEKYLRDKKQEKLRKNNQEFRDLNNQKIYKEECVVTHELEDDEEKFINFIVNNDKDYSVSEVYKLLGLSARKGNKIKNSLLNKNLIKIEEIKNNKGWKKIIRPQLALQ